MTSSQRPVARYSMALACALALAAGPVQAKTFRMADQGDALSMDPHMFNEAVQLSLTGNVYEGLTGRGKKLETVPALATDWKQTAPTVWRFRLRPDVKFQDGTPFSADDVQFSFERSRGEGSDVKIYVGSIKEIRRIDAHTIDIVTHEPFPILPKMLTTWFIMSKAWCEKNGAARPVDVRKGTENYASAHANGTGPFMLKSREPGVRTVLVVNPTWWDKPEHNLTEVVFTPIGNAATRVAALISGEIDMMEPVPLQDIPRVEGNPGLKILQGMEARTIFLDTRMPSTCRTCKASFPCKRCGSNNPSPRLMARIKCSPATCMSSSPRISANIFSPDRYGKRLLQD